MANNLPVYNWRSRRVQPRVKCRCDDCQTEVLNSRSGFCGFCGNGRQITGHEDRVDVYADGGNLLSWCTGNNRYIPHCLKFCGDQVMPTCNICRRFKPHVPPNDILVRRGIAIYPRGYIQSFFPKVAAEYLHPGIIDATHAQPGGGLHHPPPPQPPHQHGQGSNSTHRSANMSSSSSPSPSPSSSPSSSPPYSISSTPPPQPRHQRHNGSSTRRRGNQNITIYGPVMFRGA